MDDKTNDVIIVDYYVLKEVIWNKEKKEEKD